MDQSLPPRRQRVYSSCPQLSSSRFKTRHRSFRRRTQQNTSGGARTPACEPCFTDLGTDIDAKDNQDAKDNSDPVDFDFDGFTLESVRERKKSVEREPSGTSVRTISRYGKHSDHNYHGGFRYVSTSPTTSFQKQSTMSRSGGRDVNRSTFQLSSTAAAAGFPMAKKKELTAVVMRGWLQKRKGLVLKRWKPYYCLFKSDDSLCLYASEDTINGKLEQRYQVLRVVLTDKNDSFHIIGVDTEGSPRREEFRASVSPEWNNWFQVLGRFFDSSSMEQAFVRKPELTFARTLNESEEGDWVDNNVDPVPTSRTYQPYDERHSYFGQRKQSIAAVRNSFDGSGDDKTSTVSSIGVNSVPLETGKVGNQKLSDCPMIERKSHGTVPILEIRASEPKRAEVEATLASGFSWTR
ncbi:PH domain-like [Phytophthora cactorum]|nr:PH domain-like [Phytophthora cactorum]